MNTAEMKADTDVLAHIQNLNADLDRRAEEEGWTFYTKHWEGRAEKYETVYDFELSQAIQTYSDVYKEEYGIRPRLDREWTLEEVKAKIDLLFS